LIPKFKFVLHPIPLISTNRQVVDETSGIFVDGTSVSCGKDGFS